MGVEIREDKVLEVKQDDSGIAGLVLESGVTAAADLYVDSSGFVSLLLGKTLGEPFNSFKSSLFCDRAVVGGWTRSDEPIHPYTTCETMDSGWCWQIEHETRINRGYVYCSSFIGDEEAERQFRAKNPKVGPTRIVKFVTGCYPRAWVKNVVAIGNATGFVEPLEATALGVIATQSWLLADSLIDSDRMMLPTQMAAFNDYHLRSWVAIRACIAMHYKFNTRLDTPFWRECREKTDLAGAERVVEYYRQNGPSALHKVTLLDPHDQFQAGGYYTLLLGMKVPFRQRSLDAAESRRWEAFRQHNRQIAQKALTAREAMDMIRSPRWKWGSPQPAPGASAASAFGGPGR